MFDPPILINCRDRVAELRQLVAWLERAGHTRITLLDNDSTYPPLLEYLEQSPHRVIRLGENHGSYAPWRVGIVPDELWVYTDPDVIPLDECPLGAVGYLRELMDAYPDFPKVGLGLHLTDVPPQTNMPWERSLVCDSPRERPEVPSYRLESGVYSSLVDTTFALCRPDCPDAPFKAIRTGYPYQVRHMPWYTTTLSEEDAYYLAHCKAGAGYSSWADRHQREVKHEISA